MSSGQMSVKNEFSCPASRYTVLVAFVHMCSSIASTNTVEHTVAYTYETTSMRVRSTSRSAEAALKVIAAKKTNN